MGIRRWGTRNILYNNLPVKAEKAELLVNNSLDMLVSWPDSIPGARKSSVSHLFHDLLIFSWSDGSQAPCGQRRAQQAERTAVDIIQGPDGAKEKFDGAQQCYHGDLLGNQS